MYRLRAEARRRAMEVQSAPARLRPLASPRENRRLLQQQLRRNVREVLAVWWYALPFRLSTIETRRAGRADRASAQLAAALRSQGSTSREAPVSLTAPAPGAVTSYFGWRSTRMHRGMDFAAVMGASVRAAAPGTVVFAGELDVYGKVIAIAHGGGVATVYAHLSSNTVVDEGQSVARGETVARAGATGNAFGPHLHFEVRTDGIAVDPLPWLEQGARNGAPARPDAAPTGLRALRRVGAAWLSRQRWDKV
jgi:murein DD-endopeptidase MepM/ murein hydrolase activator NlpD